MTNDLPKHRTQPEQIQSKTSKPLEPIASADLLQGRRERQIMHGNEVYRLTLTRTGKLILHK